VGTDRDTVGRMLLGWILIAAAVVLAFAGVVIQRATPATAGESTVLTRRSITWVVWIDATLVAIAGVILATL
jgi:hypothetical protein